jgi:hypothetical protein
MLRTFASLTLFVVLGASAGFGIPVLAPPAPACSGFGSGPANDISIQFAVWTAPNFFCEQNDKIFSNFSVGAGLPTNTVLELQMQSVGGFDLHGVTFSGNFLTAFTLSYDIAIDLTQFNGQNRIVRVSGDLSNPSAVGDPATAKAVFTEGGTLLGTVTSLVGTPGVPLVISQTAVHVLDAYIPGGGAAVSVSNTFAQQQVPEPTALAMIGSGLVLAGALKLKRKRN